VGVLVSTFLNKHLPTHLCVSLTLIYCTTTIPTVMMELCNDLDSTAEQQVRGVAFLLPLSLSGEEVLAFRLTNCTLIVTGPARTCQLGASHPPHTSSSCPKCSAPFVQPHISNQSIISTQQWGVGAAHLIVSAVREAPLM
jgi:hypothetical protein